MQHCCRSSLHINHCFINVCCKQVCYAADNASRLDSPFSHSLLATQRAVADRAARREASSAVWHAQNTIHEACSGAAVCVRDEHIRSKQRLAKRLNSWSHGLGVTVHERLLWCAHTPLSSVPTVRQLLNCNKQ